MNYTTTNNILYKDDKPLERTFIYKKYPKPKRLTYKNELNNDIINLILFETFYTLIRNCNFPKASKLLLLHKQFAPILFKRIFKTTLPPMTATVNLIRVLFLLDTIYTQILIQRNVHNSEYFIIEIEVDELLNTPEINPWDFMHHNTIGTYYMIRLLNVFPPQLSTNQNLISYTTGRSFADVAWLVDYQIVDNKIRPKEFYRPIVAIMPTREDGFVRDISSYSNNNQWQGLLKLVKYTFGPATGMFGLRESEDDEDDLVLFKI
jgi:hypothetical protein